MVRLTYDERVSSFSSVTLYGFPEILPTKTEVVFGAHLERINRQSEYEPSLQPEGMSLSGNIYNHLVRRDVRVKGSVS